MCVIIDTSVASVFFTNPFSGKYADVALWINDKDGKLVHGGKLSKELLKIDLARRLIMQWSRAGRAIEVEEDRLAKEEQHVASLGLCCSNDEHVIALARQSGARILCTDDHMLIADFQNRALVPSPKGKIFSSHQHTRLLAHTSSCKVKMGKLSH